MSERALLLSLFVVLLLISWVQGNLERVAQADQLRESVHEGLEVISRHGGLPDVGSTETGTDHDGHEETLGQALSRAGTLPEEQEHGHAGGEEDDHAPAVPGHHHHPGCGHHHEHGGGHADGETEAMPISTGMIMILQHLGLNELAANLLWIQMDADSHAGMWHRVNFALELIPALDPHFIEAFLLRAHVLDSAMKQVGAAIALLEKAVKHNPYRSELHIQLGIYALNFNNRHGPHRDLEKALGAFRRCLDLTDAPYHAVRFYAFTLAAMGKRAEAVAVLRQVEGFPGRPKDQRALDKEAITRIESGETF